VSSKLVLDASAAVRMVLADEGATWVLDQVERAALILVPRLFATETANALAKYVSAGRLTAGEATDKLETALSIPDLWIEDESLATEALTLAVSKGHPAYDALYAVLARRNGCPVLSFDRRLGRLLESAGVSWLTPSG
jgi:predicted nucleic acid-binding protein